MIFTIPGILRRFKELEEFLEPVATRERPMDDNVLNGVKFLQLMFKFNSVHNIDVEYFFIICDYQPYKGWILWYYNDIMLESVKFNDFKEALKNYIEKIIPSF